MNGEIYHNHELKDNITKISVLPILIYRFSDFPIQSPAGFYFFQLTRWSQDLNGTAAAAAT